MKSFILSICLIVVTCATIQAQNLAPSTVRQIFSLEKGDSLEYHKWTAIDDNCGHICDTFRLNIIDSTYYNTGTGTLTIIFSSEVIYTGSLSCGFCRDFYTTEYFSLNSGKWVITELDSSIQHYIDTIYLPDGGCDGGFTLFPDSVYNQNGQYNGGKQNHCYFGTCIMYQWSEIYVDSLGMVYRDENSGTMFNDTEQLIYYHKANGGQWGTPFVYTGINNLVNENIISIFPNPTERRFTIQCNDYTGMRFELYDVLSKQVMNLSITSTTTEVNKNNLPAGIYCWRVVDGMNVVKAGKLVLE